MNIIKEYGIESTRKAVKDMYTVLSRCYIEHGFIPDGDYDKFGPENELEEHVVDAIYSYIYDNSNLLLSNEQKWIHFKDEAPADFMSFENFWKAVMKYDGNKPVFPIMESWT